MKDGKIAVVESEAEQVRLIYRRYLELSGVNALVRDLKERNIRTKTRPLATGGTRGGIPFERGSLFYLLRNRFYIGEVRYKGEILPGEQPPIVDRLLFDAVQQKLTDQWTTKSSIRNAGDHLLTGLLFDDAGHRMAPTHATKSRIRAAARCSRGMESAVRGAWVETAITHSPKKQRRCHRSLAVQKGAGALRQERDFWMQRPGTRGGIPFERGSLFYLLRNRFYIGEVRYKGEILPGEQPPIMDRLLFDAVQQKLTDQWTTKSSIRNAGDHLLTGLLFDDAGHRMAPTHATKAGIRYRYYVSLPCLHGEARTAKVGSVTRLPATDVEDVVVKSINEHVRSQSGMPASTMTERCAIAGMVDRIDVHKDRLAVQLRSRENPGTIKSSGDIEPTDDRLLSIPWQKPPSKRFRQILLPHGSSRNQIRPERPERRLRLVSAIARGRRWLDEIISGSVTNAEQIALRERYSVRHVNMTISLAFLAPKLVRAAVEGRLPRGINIERLRDAPAEWSRQFEALGLNPQ
jgi:hypothetical protein